MKKNLHSFLLLVVIFSALIPARNVAAQEGSITVDIQPDGDSMKDSFIYKELPGLNEGGNPVLSVGEPVGLERTHRALMEFNLTGLPMDLSVSSATLTLTIKDNQWSNTARTLYVYVINNDWAEYSVNWDWRYNTQLAWAEPGVMGDGDILPEPVGSYSMTPGMTINSTIAITITDTTVIEALVKQNYFGFLLAMDVEHDDLYEFYSSDYSNADYRPKLTVTYTPDSTDPVDPGWECVNSGDFSHCDPLELGHIKSPYMTVGVASPNSIGNMGGIHVKPTKAFKLNCDPYPRCINDYPVHYRFEYDAAWIAAGDTNGTLGMVLSIPGGTEVVQSVACDSGTTGKCRGIFEGIISVNNFPVNYDGGFTIGLQTGIAYPSSWPVTSMNIGWKIYLSLEPFDMDCVDTYYVPVLDTYDINPTLETPLGFDGEPPDNQIYPTEIGTLYMVKVENSWNDGSGDRTDAAVSYDGVEWMTWEEFQVDAVCVDVMPGDEMTPDYWIIYFEAPTVTFHIRVNDESGAFGNNSVNGLSPYRYTAGIALELAEVGCGASFSFDPEMDLLLSANILSTSEGTMVNDAQEDLRMQEGEWYAIEVASGTWNEPNQTPNIEMEYQFQNLIGTPYPENYEDLLEGGAYVQCTTGNFVYVQAPAPLLGLRVNDQDGNFANNTGTLGINIYHATFTRPSDTCELSFALDILVRSDSVEAQMENGKVFGLMVGSALTNDPTQEENNLSYGLVPGAWYALETTGGPWGYYGAGHGDMNDDQYGMEVAESQTIGASGSDNWGDLAAWERSECNIQTDKLGHRLVYFQMPITGAYQFMLRVQDISDFSNNTGSMSWNLYRAIDLGPQDSGLCDYTYSTKINQTVLTVRANAPDGAYLGTNQTEGEPPGTYTPLEPNTYYAIELLGTDFQWFEVNGGDPHIDMEFSANNGTSWGDLPGASGVLCALTDGDNTIFFIHTGTATTPQFKLRVNSTSFDDNYGFMAYNIYEATAGPSIDPYDGCVTEGYSTTSLGPYTWIPVTDPAGIGVNSTNPADPEVNGLVPGNHYIIEISRGPWFDGETTYDNNPEKLLEKYRAQVSADGGATWQEMDGTNPNVDCWEYSPDFKYYKIEFTVQTGQIWRIRVADNDSATFTDNTGNLTYTLKGLVLPADTSVTGTFTLAGCNTPPIFPGALSASELLNLGNYLAEWFDYLVGSVVSFFAWCPENTAMVTMFGEDINKKDPFALFDEMDGVLNDIKNEINGYNWSGSGQDYSILTKSPAQSAAMINQYIFGPLPSDSPWMGGDLVDFTVTPDVNMYADTCSLAITNYIGPLLSKGVCFASNWARQTGLMFYVQLMLDVGVVFAALHSVLANFKRVIYLFTGVNTSIMSSDQKVFINTVAETSTASDRAIDAQLDELRKLNENLSKADWDAIRDIRNRR